MLFNSITFFIAFCPFLLIYYIVPRKFRWIMILASSLLFYCTWSYIYVLIAIISITLDYAISLFIEKSKEQFKNYLIILSLVINIGVLFVFKYYDFFIDLIIHAGFKFLNSYELHLIMPLGLSFYTFQKLGYMIDVYRGKIRAEKNYFVFAAYTLFFPCIISGPIERGDRLIPQIKKPAKLSYSNITDGVKLFFIGLFKKMVIADTLNIYVEKVFTNLHKYSGIQLVIAMIFFAVQIYCDFGAVSDMARAIAKMLGIEVMENFKTPYFAASIKDFWRRWHISLSSWFRDYLYIPLGGNRVEKYRWYLNNVIVFVVCGLWHGANLTFLLWGLIHGLYQVIGISTKRIRANIKTHLKIAEDGRINKIIGIPCTFFLVCFAWIFFRAKTIEDAGFIVKELFVGKYSISAVTHLRISQFHIISIILGIIILLIMDVISSKQDLLKFINKKNIIIRFAVYYLFVIIIIFMGVYGYAEKSQFIYMHF